MSDLHGLAAALDTAVMSDRLGVVVTRAELVRLKPGRRALVRYATISGLLLGKLRSGHRATTPYKLLGKLRAAGLTEHSELRVAVPEPVAVFPDLDLWVQRLVPGRELTAPLDEASGDDDMLFDLGARAARAAHLVHMAGVAPRRAHCVADELRVLDARLAIAGQRRSDLMPRFERLAVEARRVAASLDARPTTGIHRDYYPDQLLIDGALTTVVDFDLYCIGDPALDIGNFAGHVVELALRTRRDEHALDAAIDGCVSTFLTLAGAAHSPALDAYTTLTLMRLVALSTELDGRATTTDAMLDLTERRARVCRTNSGRAIKWALHGTPSS